MLEMWSLDGGFYFIVSFVRGTKTLVSCLDSIQDIWVVARLTVTNKEISLAPSSLPHDPP